MKPVPHQAQVALPPALPLLLLSLLMCACTIDVNAPEPSPAPSGCDLDGDGFRQFACGGDDCDDSNPEIHRDANEVCNALDDDCDGETDEGVALTYYDDLDGDGYGDPASGTSHCEPPRDTVENAEDCDDDPSTGKDIHPGASETCNGVDDDCDQLVDEGVTLTFFLDDDQDGYGDPSESAEACQAPPGYVANADDCDDDRTAVHPDADEICGDNLDNNCDGDMDEGFDVDGDGYLSCEDDCDDTRADVYPGALEVCDGSSTKPGTDEDCDGDTDEGFDLDGDGYTQCAGDCDDTRADVYPGALEVCDGSSTEPGTDEDCDGKRDEGFDQDRDGVTTCGGDCDDDDAAAYPGADEIPNNGIDEDCDGHDLTDVDGDGFPGLDEDGNVWDCDDTNPDIYPGARETCNQIDDDCDGWLDPPPDTDGDGWSQKEDCNDLDPAIHPDGQEICDDAADNDCDGTTDEIACITCTTELTQGDVEVISQAALVSLAGVSRIEGTLNIHGADVSDLSPLICLTRVAGTLILSSTSLITLAGLEHLETVDGDLIVENNEVLERLSDLHGLTAVGGDLTIRRNDILANLDGLDHLETLSNLYLSDNEALSSLSGLDNLAHVENQLLVEGAGRLVSLSGLEHLEFVGNLTISDNPALETLHHLLNLTQVGRDVSILDNDSLEDLRGLEQVNVLPSEYGDLGNVTGNLTLRGNRSLRTLHGLERLGFVHETLEVSQNPSLESLEGLQTLVETTGLTLQDNVTLQSLSGLSSLKGAGDVQIRGCDALSSLDFGTYEMAASSLTIDENDHLADISGVQHFSSITGPASVSDNCRLAQADAEAFGAYLENHGAAPVTLDGNGLEDCDGDGFTVEAGDCDDTDPETFPGAAERCDGLDNDCNGDIDDGQTLSAFYPDSDGDGHGANDGSATLACKAPPGMADTPTDCDDTDPSSYPGALELCNDQADNDCDGEVDESSCYACAPSGTCVLCDRGTFTPTNGEVWPSGSTGQIEACYAGYVAIDGKLTLEMDTIQRLDPLICLRTVGGTLSVAMNEGLLSLEGLDSLEHIAGKLRVEHNDVLRTLDGLEGLRIIDDNISIQSNSSLVSVDALSNVASCGKVTLSDNASLCTDDAEALAVELQDATTGTITVSGNDESCSP